MRKIVVLGPESTGKSSLCEALANRFGGSWCPEFARGYLELHGSHYSYEDLLKIAQGQLDLEDRVTKAALEAGHEWLFLDTDMYVMKVWCEFVFGNCHPFILGKIAERKYDHYLLCNIDLPWTRDSLREYPDEGPRKELFRIYHELLESQDTPWSLVSGMGNERIDSAAKAIR